MVIHMLLKEYLENIKNNVLNCPCGGIIAGMLGRRTRRWRGSRYSAYLLISGSNPDGDTN